jgi:hypothetical protein
LSSAALAGTVATSLIVISIGAVPAFRNSVFASVVSLGALFTSVGTSTRPIIITPPPLSTVDPAPATPGGTSGTGQRPAAGRTSVGMNLASPTDYGGERSFMNLVAGSRWMLVSPANVWGDMPADRLNGDRVVVRLEAGESAVRAIQPPALAYQGKSVDIACRWSGKGTLHFSNWVATNVKLSANGARFTYVHQVDQRPIIYVTKTDPSDPLRDFDCREADADPDVLFDPGFIANVSKYRVLRFMDWQNTNANLPVTWATRTRPGMGEFRGDDGVSIEHMVALANQARVDPWFIVPWNADPDYVRRFAQYVRDNLSPDLQAYVELGNEVWNWGFKVTVQADAEGKARGLSSQTGYAMYMRYAEKTIETMDIWSDVFKGQTSRIVRVVATQNGHSGLSTQLFSFRDLPDHIDALATAPYFYVDAEPTAATNLDDFFNNVLPARIAFSFKTSDVHKALATKYGKRFITYEGGQHLITPDLDLARKIQRDPRMGQLYTQYLTEWDKRYGDLVTLFNDVGPISKFGAWGAQEYFNQPASQAPKYGAIVNFIASTQTK